MRSRSELFGFPRILALNRKQMVTGKQVAAQVDRLMRGWVKDKAEIPPADTGREGQ